MHWIWWQIEKVENMSRLTKIMRMCNWGRLKKRITTLSKELIMNCATRRVLACRRWERMISIAICKMSRYKRLKFIMKLTIKSATTTITKLSSCLSYCLNSNNNNKLKNKTPRNTKQHGNQTYWRIKVRNHPLNHTSHHKTKYSQSMR